MPKIEANKVKITSSINPKESEIKPSSSSLKDTPTLTEKKYKNSVNISFTKTDEDELEINANLRDMHLNSDKKFSPNTLDLGLTTDSDDDSSGYESEDDLKPKDEKKTYKKRLMIGDGNCNYSVALIKKHLKKHPNLGAAITVSDLSSETSLEDCYGEKFSDNIDYLSSKHANLNFGLDGTKMHESKDLQENYERIHFNFPHDKSDYNKQTLPQIIDRFFSSARALQNEGDRVHMALPKPAKSWLNQFYKGIVYNIYDNAAKNGYRLFKKRQFDSKRYPGYEHVITGQNENAQVSKDAREYIFEKTNKTAKQILKEDNETSGRFVLNRDYGDPFKGVYRNCIPEISTDDDSSDYESEAPKFKNK